MNHSNSNENKINEFLKNEPITRELFDYSENNNDIQNELFLFLNKVNSK